jgi:3-oxoacyl-[acyl-carrier protein] reductase
MSTLLADKVAVVPRLAEVAECAAFIASDRAGPMTGTITNLTCGSLIE